MAKRKKSKPANLPVEVDMVSDFVCPWCWLGYKQFIQAADKTKPRPNLSFRPYMLDSAVPEEGADYREYMKAKFGDKPDNRFNAMRDHLEAAGPDAGIAFDFKAITRRPNTLNAHRLMRWAQGQDLGHECAEQLFRAYMEKGEDIGDLDILCRIAGDIGMDAELVRDLLGGGQDKVDIQNEMLFFRGLGVTGVPFFIYAGQMAVTGAQPPETHRKVLADAAKLEPQDI
ncbi:DSBA oxidoreductase [Litorimonas cladophorae]|uniref:DSBA oxidoreductase n=1 Tax=Litorimonas cladophorae TaxID=1220491 RepID=A0A918NJF5_9PROT|nr:DsbA family oxidoreductase [Litorimonas cladophorae]GGX71936.1 DSBA oxidoreductase [Litorimonas cladophorae]